MSTKKIDNSTFTNKADEDAAAAVAAALAKGEDPFGDDDQDEAVEAQADQDDDAEDEAGEVVEAVEAVEALAAPEPVPEEAVADELAPTYRTPPLADLDAQRTTLRAEKDKAFGEFDEGTINREQYLEITRRVDDKLDDLTSQRALLQANKQARQAQQQGKLAQISAAAKADGTIDYGTQDAADEFDAALRFVGSLKSNARLNFDAMADKAHVMVLAQRGIVAKPVAAALPGKPAPRTAPARPVTLAGIPAAATTGTSGSIGDKMSRLHGLAVQDYVDSMPKAQRDAYLDS